MRAAERVRKALRALPEPDRAAALKALATLVSQTREARSERAELKRLQVMIGQVSRAGLATERRKVLR